MILTPAQAAAIARSEELAAFLTGLSSLDNGRTAYACFTVAELAELVGISNRDVIDALRTEADYWLDGRRYSHDALVAELARRLDGVSGEVDCNVFRGERWALGLAVALHVIDAGGVEE